MHELGHTLGFYHEQSRPDRDQFVNIKWENIIKKNSFNFNKQVSIAPCVILRVVLSRATVDAKCKLRLRKDDAKKAGT